MFCLFIHFFQLALLQLHLPNSAVQRADAKTLGFIDDVLDNVKQARMSYWPILNFCANDIQTAIASLWWITGRGNDHHALLEIRVCTTLLEAEYFLIDF